MKPRSTGHGSVDVVGRRQKLEKPPAPKGPRLVIAALVVVALAIALALALAWRHYRDATLRWAAVSGIAAVGALLLAIVAGVVALAAYMQALQRPYLVVRAYQRNSAGTPVLMEPLITSRWPHDGSASSANSERLMPLLLSLAVSNSGKASARNIRLRLSLFGLVWYPSTTLSDGWQIREQGSESTTGISKLVWEGGANYSIHGDGDTRIFHLDLTDLHLDRSDPHTPRVFVQVVADGFREKDFRFPVEVN